MAVRSHCPLAGDVPQKPSIRFRPGPAVDDPQTMLPVRRFGRGRFLRRSKSTGTRRAMDGTIAIPLIPT